MNPPVVSTGPRATAPPALPLSPGTASGRVLQALRGLIDSGRFPLGKLLPAEEELCVEMEVSRGTLRKALKQLEIEGVLQAHRGQGRVVIGAPAGGGAGLIAQAVVIISHLPAEAAGDDHPGTLQAIESGALRSLREKGIHRLLIDGHGITPAGAAQLMASRPRGIIVGGAVADYFPNRELLLQIATQVPLVVNSNEPLWQGCDRVLSDQEAGARLLTNWLLAQGKQRIVRVWTTSERHEWLIQRDAGFERAMREAGLEPAPAVIVHGCPATAPQEQGEFQTHVRHLAGFLIEHLRTADAELAFMATSDSEAAALASACRLFGREPQRDVTIVGYDNQWRTCREAQWEPSRPAATVDKQNAFIGSMLAEVIMDRVQGRLAGPPVCRLVPPELIILP
jgi:DNA-binding LacI/PurR family transcriptional regulator